MVRAHIFFNGTVQGVGFRYTCLSYAQQAKLTGWVRNIDDGRVEVAVEGPRPDIETLIGKLKVHFGCESQEEWLEDRAEFEQFSVEF